MDVVASANLRSRRIALLNGLFLQTGIEFSRDGFEQLEWLAPLQPTGIAITHADATEHIGAVVELSCATRLPLAYVNSGLALPGALAPADPTQLAERLLP